MAAFALAPPLDSRPRADWSSPTGRRGSVQMFLEPVVTSRRRRSRKFAAAPIKAPQPVGAAPGASDRGGWRSSCARPAKVRLGASRSGDRAGEASEGERLQIYGVIKWNATLDYKSHRPPLVASFPLSRPAPIALSLQGGQRMMGGAVNRVGERPRIMGFVDQGAREGRGSSRRRRCWSGRVAVQNGAAR